MTEPVLFIAYYFPPAGGPGMYRSLNFAKNLAANNYRPFVLTITEQDVTKGSYPMDESLLSLLPADLDVTRVNSGEPLRLRKLFMRLHIFRLFWFVFFPFFFERSALWPYTAYEAAAELIRKHKIKLVYTTSGPFSPMLLAYLLKRNRGIKWVADIRDPYTDGYMWQWPSKIHWLFSRWVERIILSKADKIVMNTPAASELYKKRKILPESQITFITNGF